MYVHYNRISIQRGGFDRNLNFEWSYYFDKSYYNSKKESIKDIGGNLKTGCEVFVSKVVVVVAKNYGFG